MLNPLTHQLSPNTQAILLLCASFGKSRTEYPAPLSLTEYNQLANELRSRQMQPADLLTPQGIQELSQIPHSLEQQRLINLLGRGVLLSLAFEKWTNQGLWILTRSDQDYPKRLKKHLKYLSPPVFYGIGNRDLLNQGGLAVVGSRQVDEEGLNYTQFLAETCAEQQIQIVSGGARGVDQCAMLSSLVVGGSAIGILADCLAKAALSPQYREGIHTGKLTLISPYDPEARFHVGNAMGRNKYIYALADYGVVISAEFQKGGTWTGAVEALEKLPDVPLFVRLSGNIPLGNSQLHQKGAKPFPEMPWSSPFCELLKQGSSSNQGQAEQMALDLKSYSPSVETSQNSIPSSPP